MFDGRDYPIVSLVGNENKICGSSEARSRSTYLRLDEVVKNLSGGGCHDRDSRLFRSTQENGRTYKYNTLEPGTS